MISLRWVAGVPFLIGSSGLDIEPISGPFHVVVPRPWGRDQWRDWRRWDDVARAEGGSVRFAEFFA